VHAGLHPGFVFGPFPYLVGIVIKGVGIGIAQDAGRLAVDHPGNELLQGGILFDKLQVRPHLGGAVAQPHGVDVAGDYIGIGPALAGVKGNSGVEGIGKTVFEQPAQFRVFHFRLEGVDGPFHGLAFKTPGAWRRPHHRKSSWGSKSERLKSDTGADQGGTLYKSSSIHGQLARMAG
jgi:hypothetical protein